MGEGYLGGVVSVMHSCVRVHVEDIQRVPADGVWYEHRNVMCMGGRRKQQESTQICIME